MTMQLYKGIHHSGSTYILFFVLNLHTQLKVLYLQEKLFQMNITFLDALDEATNIFLIYSLSLNSRCVTQWGGHLVAKRTQRIIMKGSLELVYENVAYCL